jgi:16S rRNA (uracil1498-N3)-methyltransferase
MSDRFFVESPITGDSAVLTGQEALHLSKVLRARVGDVVDLFDGSGVEFSARIEEIKKDAIRCSILGRRETDTNLIRSMTFGVALPKGDRQRVLIEKLTELGVTSLTPLITERSVVQPDEQTAARLRRTVLEASKQCGRNRLMEIRSPCGFSEFLTTERGLRVIAHPANKGRDSVLRRPSPILNATEFLAAAEKSPDPITIAIGPEGGFTDDELNHAIAAGWLQVDLGRNTLRVETAAIALAAIGCVVRHSTP